VRSIGKKLPSRNFQFPFFSSSERELRLSFLLCSLDSYPTLSLGIGVRLNTYSDSIGPPSFPQRANLERSSSAAIQRRDAVQKHTQSTHWLSIQIEGGCRITGRWRPACDSSFLWTCHWGGCSKNIRSEVMSAANACTVGARTASFFRTKETGGIVPVLSPSLVSVGKGIDTAGKRVVNWPQHLATAPNRIARIAGFAQRRARALVRQELCSATGRGIALIASS